MANILIIIINMCSIRVVECALDEVTFFLYPKLVRIREVRSLYFFHINNRIRVEY